MWSANAYCFSDEKGISGLCKLPCSLAKSPRVQQGLRVVVNRLGQLRCMILGMSELTVKPGIRTDILGNKLRACRLRVKLTANELANYKHRRREQMEAKFVSCCMGRAHRLSFFVGCATSVLVALQTLALGASSAAIESLTGSNLGAGNLATTDSAASPAPEKGDQVNVKTYGAVGDGVTDDTAAFDAALKSLADAGGGTCLVPKGTYLISASGITSHVKSGVHLVGEGHTSILKIAAAPTGPLIWGDGNDWSIEKLALDMGDYVPSTRRPAITCRGDNWRVANCSVLRIGIIGISVSGGNNWTIERNHISKTVPAQTLNACILVTKLGETRATNGRVIDNVCVGSGIMFWGFNSTIARNRVTGSGFGSGIFTGIPINAHTLKIRDNICSGGRGFDENRTWVSGFELWSSDSIIEGNVAYDNDGGGIIIGGKKCVVIANDAYDNGVHLPKGAGFVARYKSEDVNASGSVFIGNRAHNSRSPNNSATTQAYGYAEQPGRLHDIVHIGNDYNGNRIRSAEYHSTTGQPNVSADQGSRVIQMRLSPEMKTRLKALAKDADTPDTTRRALHDISADR
jgi:parallel beta-helix repeat protein